MLAWHAVAWLALLSSVEGADIGRATGLVQFGNSIGFASGPPLIGYLVDRSGSYDSAWALVTALFALAVVLTAAWRRTTNDDNPAL